ncbi:ATP-binding protein [Rhodocyclaceae bacterium]
MLATLLKQLLPRTLLWRAFWLIALLMLLAVAAWLAIFSEAELDRRSRQIAQMLTSVTNLTRTALLTAHPAQRHELLAELADLEGLHVYPADAEDRIERPPSIGLTHRIEALLIDKLGPETQLAFAVNGESGLFVRFRIFPGADGNYWLGLPRERLARHLPWQWIGWGLAVLLLSLAGAWLIVYRIVRPIEEERALLLAGISHDLRTPLTRLRMEIEMSVADETTRTEMEADIIEMDRTIGQFLDFARPIDATPAVATDLANLLGEIAARYGERVDYRRPASADFSASIRPDALRRAVINLIENALRHAGAPVELELSRDHRQVVIIILDRGPGIAPADIERLKQPFTRGEMARTGAGGAGLGLAIVDRLVRLQGGRFELAPRPGGGLAARILLPV